MPANCNADTLAAAAELLEGISARGLITVETAKLNTHPSGPGLTPATLEAAAAVLHGLSERDHLVIDTYLFALRYGGSTDPAVLTAAAQVYGGFGFRRWEAAKAYLCAFNQGGTTDAQDLITAGEPFDGYSRKDHWAAQTYCLAIINSLAASPGALLSAAKGFQKVDAWDLRLIQLLTACNWPACLDVPADLIPVISATYQGTGEIDILTVVLPKVCCNPNPGFIDIYEADDAIGTGASLCSSGGIPAGQAGASNYTVNFPAVAIDCLAKKFILVKQECAGSFSGFSNAVLRINNGLIAANNFSTRAQANGGVAPPPAILTALETLYNDLDTAGLISKIIALNAFDPTNLVNACTPFIVNAGNDPWTNNNFVAGDLNADGLIGNGTNKYLQTGIIPSVQWPIVTPIHGGIGIYTLTPDDAAMSEFGTQQGGNNEVLVNSSGGNAVFDTYGGTCGVDAICVANSLFRGFLIGSRTTNAHAELFKASALSPFASIGTLLTPGNDGASNNTEMVCHANNINGVVGQFSRRRMSFAVVFNNMSAAECQDLYNAAETCRHNMGGGFVVDLNNATEVVNDWERRVVLAGGAAASAATKTALTTFWNACITAGIQEKFYSLCPFVPDNLIAAITPLIDTAGLPSYTNTGFVGADLTVNGLKGDGAAKYLDTGVASDRIFNSTSGPFGCLGLYVSLGASESKVDTGSQFFTGSPDFWLASDFSGTMIFDCWNNGTGRTSFANTPFTGFICASRTTAARTDIYTADSGLPIASRANNTNNSAGATIPEYPIFVFAIDDTGAASVFSSKRLSFFWVGQGLSATEASDLFNAVQQLRTDLGGGFV